MASFWICAVDTWFVSESNGSYVSGKRPASIVPVSLLASIPSILAFVTALSLIAAVTTASSSSLSFVMASFWICAVDTWFVSESNGSYVSGKRPASIVPVSLLASIPSILAFVTALSLIAAVTTASSSSLSFVMASFWICAVDTWFVSESNGSYELLRLGITLELILPFVKTGYVSFVVARLPELSVLTFFSEVNCSNLLIWIPSYSSLRSIILLLLTAPELILPVVTACD